MIVSQSRRVSESNSLIVVDQIHGILEKVEFLSNSESDPCKSHRVEILSNSGSNICQSQSPGEFHRRIPKQ